jgi:hypothetical protein
MPTGPEHYREAERLLDIAATYGAEHAGEPAAAEALAAAQAHATLALAAATTCASLFERSGARRRDDALEWAKTIGGRTSDHF